MKKQQQQKENQERVNITPQDDIMRQKEGKPRFFWGQKYQKPVSMPKRKKTHGFLLCSVYYTVVSARRNALRPFSTSMYIYIGVRCSRFPFFCLIFPKLTNMFF